MSLLSLSLTVVILCLSNTNIITFVYGESLKLIEINCSLTTIAHLWPCKYTGTSNKQDQKSHQPYPQPRSRPQPGGDTFIPLPRDIMSDITTVMNDCFNYYSSRIMVNVKHFSQTFRKDLKLGNLSFSDGKLSQAISVNVGTKVTSAYHEGQEVLSVFIPCVVPLVTFTYNYQLTLDNKTSTGRLKLDVFDQPITITLAVLRGEDQNCYMNPMDLSFDKQLKGYKVLPTNYAHSESDLDAIKRIAEQVMKTIVYKEYKEEVESFTFKVLKESLVQSTGAIKSDDMFRKLCDFIHRL